MLLRQSSKAIRPRTEKLIACDEKCVGAQLGEGCEGGLNLVITGSLEDGKVEPLQFVSSRPKPQPN